MDEQIRTSPTQSDQSVSKSGTARKSVGIDDGKSASVPVTQSVKTAVSVDAEASDLAPKRSADDLLDELYNSIDEAPKEVSTAVSHTPKKRSRRSRSKKRAPRSRKSVIRNKPTILTFRVLENQLGKARCQLVLCNISERSLHFKLKSGTGSCVEAVPFGNAHIAPHSQVRLTLTWSKPEVYTSWKDAPLPKLLLITKFLDGESEEDHSTTHTRLMARISLSRTCSSADPPVEQLLLDAVGKPTDPQREVAITPPQPLSSETVKDPSTGNALADFVNGLTDRGLCVLIVILAVIVMIFAGGRK